jgi:ribosomal protein S18 acetylase RimI-like enzyme
MILNKIVERNFEGYKSYRKDMKNIKKYFIDDKNNNFWVVKCDNVVIGCIGGLFRGDGNFELLSNSVNKQFRGRGLAKKLCSKVEEFAKMKKYSKIILSTSSFQFEAIELYKKFNFKEVKRVLENNLTILYFEKLL